MAATSDPQRTPLVSAGARTPFTKVGTDLANVPAHELLRVALQEAMERAGLRPEHVDEVIAGNIAQPAEATNITRVAALQAGVPQSVPAFTVNRNCGSALQAIADGALRIRSGRARVVLVGGTESMSHIPLLFSEDAKAAFFRLMRARGLGARLGALAGFRPRHFRPTLALEVGLTDITCGLNMGQTAENLARQFGVSRRDQDDLALLSHQRAAAAWTEGRLAEEVVPVPLAPRYSRLVERDVGFREAQTLEALGKLRPYFDRKHGTVTVGNACPVTDGAAALVLASAARAQELGLPQLGHIRSWGFAGLDPARMGLGPVFAAAKALDEAGAQLADMELVELNEAFAAQVLSCLAAFDSREFAGKELGRASALGALDPERLNVNGGAIALGHPVGATGARLVLTLLMEMSRRGAALGLATLCIGGGQGGAMVLERCGDDA
jgi:acetyl-CoA C-acetyltransferase/acetyl-CoA acyltransferase